MARQIYRQKALARMASPDRLDQLISVLNPKAWLALTALGVIVVTAVLWSIFGRIPTTVNGSGILLSKGGVFDIEVLGSGVVTHIGPNVGDLIHRGQVIAYIDQPSIKQDIEQAERQLKTVEKEREKKENFHNRNTQLELSLMVEEQRQMKRSSEVIKERILWLEEKVKAENEALKLGIITSDALQRSVQLLESARAEDVNIEIKSAGLDKRRIALKINTEQDLHGIDLRIQQIQDNLESLSLLLAQTSKVISPYTGYLQEIKAKEGELVNVGRSIASIEKTDTPLIVVGFIPVVGQKVKSGMKVQITPVTVKREEYGFMHGTVTRVSGLPTTTQGMMRILNNSLLVEQLAAQGAPFTIEMDMDKDPNTPTGMKWSSREGPDIKIQSGTMCELRVVVREQRPLDLAIPILKSTLHLD